MLFPDKHEFTGDEGRSSSTCDYLNNGLRDLHAMSGQFKVDYRIIEKEVRTRFFPFFGKQWRYALYRRYGDEGVHSRIIEPCEKAALAALIDDLHDTALIHKARMAEQQEEAQRINDELNAITDPPAEKAPGDAVFFDSSNPNKPVGPGLFLTDAEQRVLFVSHARNPEEGQYLQLLHMLREKFRLRGSQSNRTATKTVKLIGHTLRFDLSGGKVPLLTTKKIFTRSMTGELVEWFLKGDVNNETLAALNIGIWNAWALPEDYVVLRQISREDRIKLLAEKQGETFEETKDKLFKKARSHKSVNSTRKLHDMVDILLASEGIERNREHVLYPKGHVGPLYGYQWRRFPAGPYFHNLTEQEVVEYIEAMLPDQRSEFDEQCARNQDGSYSITSARTVLSKIGIDQIAQAIDLLRRRPSSRRIIVTAWNPQVVPSDAISPQENIVLGRAGLASCHHMFQFVTEELTHQERVELVRADWLRENGHRFTCDVHLTVHNVDDWMQRDGRPYPKYRLSIISSQRLNKSALAA